MLMKPQTNRTTWAFCALLAGLTLAGVGALGLRLHPYLVAKYHGEDADLHGALLIWAPLRGADLCGADLHGANLASATLEAAKMVVADLQHASLTVVR
jgi:uncharacterized protein YjbI with pentapeptide repeats